jgi:dTMP kinase
MPTRGDSSANFPSSPTRGLLVALEGIDGAGKTTQARELAAALSAAGVAYVTTKEPTSGPWGAKIRASAQTGRLPLEEELAAFIADRREHVANLIKPSLEQGKVVIVDRYYLSTVAYQGARGLDPDELLRMNAFAPKPDLLFIFDVAPAVGLARVRSRGDVADLFEKEDELARARAIFLRLEGDPQTHVLDATQSLDVITKTIHDIVGARLGKSLRQI